MTTTSTRRPGTSNAFFVIVIVALVLIAGTFAVLYFTTVHNISNDAAPFVAAATGMEKPLPKTLDPKFHDADGNLVADPPADASQLVDPDPLVFSFVADNPTDYKAVWKDFTDHLAKVTGKRVEYAMAASTTDQLHDFIDGKLHITGFNTGSVPIAVNLGGFVPTFTLGTASAGGYLHMEIIVPADSSVQVPDDLRNQTITFVDPNSNSGCKAALVILKTKYDLMPGRDYSIRYSHGQDVSITGIADKTYDAAAVASDVLARAVAAGKIKKDQYRTIYSSEDFPAVAFGYAHNLKPALVAKIREAFSSFQFPGTSVAQRFAASHQDSFHPIDYKTDFTLVRFIDDQIGKPYHLPPTETEPAPPTTQAARQNP